LTNIKENKEILMDLEWGDWNDHNMDELLIFITFGAKLLNTDWLRQRAFFLNHEGTFGNQEGMIT